jgi:hypothetical protein
VYGCRSSLEHLTNLFVSTQLWLIENVPPLIKEIPFVDVVRIPEASPIVHELPEIVWRGDGRQFQECGEPV